MAAFIVLIRQIFLQKIFSKTQFSKLGIDQNTFVLSYKKYLKQLEDVRVDTSKIIPFNADFISNLKSLGKFTTIVNVTSDRAASNDLSKRLAFYLSRLLDRDTYILIYGSKQTTIVKSDTFGSISNRGSTERKKLMDKYFENVDVLDDPDNLLEVPNISAIKKFSMSYGKTLLCLDRNDSDVTKIASIEESDSYILVGQVGKFSETNIQKYLDFNQKVKINVLV